MTGLFTSSVHGSVPKSCIRILHTHICNSAIITFWHCPTEVSLFFFPSLQWVSHLKCHATCLQSAFFLLYILLAFFPFIFDSKLLFCCFFSFLINFSIPVISAGAQIIYLFLNCCHCNEHTSESCPFSGFLLGCQKLFFKVSPVYAGLLNEAQ